MWKFGVGTKTTKFATIWSSIPANEVLLLEKSALSSSFGGNLTLINTFVSKFSYIIQFANRKVID